MGNIQLNLFDHLVMFVIGIVMPAIAVLSARQGLEGIKITPAIKRSIYLSNSLFLWFGLAIVVAVWTLSGRPISALGLQMPNEEAPSLWIYLFIAFVVLYLVDTLSHFITRKRKAATRIKWKKYTPFMPTTWRELMWFLPVAVSAGICEEVIYRGYMINYLVTALKHQNSVFVLSVMIPAVIFGIAHIYQGQKAVLKILVMAMLFGYIYILTQSVLLLIIAHIITDMISSTAGMILLSNSDVQTNSGEEE